MQSGTWPMIEPEITHSGAAPEGGKFVVMPDRLRGRKPPCCASDGNTRLRRPKHRKRNEDTCKSPARTGRPQQRPRGVSIDFGLRQLAESAWASARRLTLQSASNSLDAEAGQISGPK